MKDSYPIVEESEALPTQLGFITVGFFDSTWTMRCAMYSNDTIAGLIDQVAISMPSRQPFDRLYLYGAIDLMARYETHELLWRAGVTSEAFIMVKASGPPLFATIRAQELLVPRDLSPLVDPCGLPKQWIAATSVYSRATLAPAQPSAAPRGKRTLLSAVCTNPTIENMFDVFPISLPHRAGALTTAVCIATGRLGAYPVSYLDAKRVGGFSRVEGRLYYQWNRHVVDSNYCRDIVIEHVRSEEELHSLYHVSLAADRDLTVAQIVVPVGSMTLDHVKRMVAMLFMYPSMIRGENQEEDAAFPGSFANMGIPSHWKQQLEESAHLKDADLSRFVMSFHFTGIKVILYLYMVPVWK
jgi:hypothetical protein